MTERSSGCAGLLSDPDNPTESPDDWQSPPVTNEMEDSRDTADERQAVMNYDPSDDPETMDLSVKEEPLDFDDDYGSTAAKQDNSDSNSDSMSGSNHSLYGNFMDEKPEPETSGFGEIKSEHLIDVNEYRLGSADSLWNTGTGEPEAEAQEPEETFVKLDQSDSLDPQLQGGLRAKKKRGRQKKTATATATTTRRKTKAPSRLAYGDEDASDANEPPTKTLKSSAIKNSGQKHFMKAIPKAPPVQEPPSIMVMNSTLKIQNRTGESRQFESRTVEDNGRPSSSTQGSVNPPLKYIVTGYSKPKNSAFEREVIQTLSDLQVKIDEVAKEQVTIKRMLNKLLSRDGVKDDDDELPDYVKFPLKTSEDVDELEEKLREDVSIKKSLISHLTGIGGSTIRENVRRVMGYALNHNVSGRYNWAGKVGWKAATGMEPKRAFGSLVLSAAISEAVLRNPFFLTTKSEVEKEIGVWLRGSCDRNGGRKRRREQKNMTDFVTFSTK